MAGSRISRRTLLQGAAALAVADLPDRVWGATRPETSALVIVYLNGGPCGLFNSADSFLENGAFGVTRHNVRDLGNGLVVDAGSFGSLPPEALRHMASINFKHGLYKHELARAALLQTGDRSNLLLLAKSYLPAPARCAVVNPLGLPGGVDPHPPTEGDIPLEHVIDLRTIGVFESPREVRQIAAAYGVGPDAQIIGDPATSFLAAELLVRAGTKVVFTQPFFTGRPDRQIDTHQDSTGAEARQVMGTIMPSLRTFVSRALALPNKNVVIALMGEFSRTIGESDHEPGGTTTVIGKYVKTGTAGRQTPQGAPPPGSPPVSGLWAFLANALKLKEHEFGVNPNPELIV